MSTGRDTADGAASVSPLLARAAAVAMHAERRLARSIQDFLTPDDARLPDRERATLAAMLAAMVAAVEGDLRRQAARTAEGIADGAPTLDRLIAVGVFDDAALMRELIARARLDLLADALPIAPADEVAAPALLGQLAASGDGAVASAALALMTAEARRRGFFDDNRLRATELPSELHHKLVWSIAAAIRDQIGGAHADRALTDAALRNLARHDESDRVEAAAMRLATAIDARPDERAALLIRAIGERQAALFTALLATALRFDFATARDLVLDRDAPLWLALRALDLDRGTIARLGLALAPDVEAFADQIDAIMAIDAEQARGALARYGLHPDLRAALARIEGTR